MKEREREAQAREKEAVRRHELEIKQLEVQAVNTDGGVSEHHSGIATAKMPKLPQFIDGQDNLDSYLQRFERFAKSNKWNESICATSLSALLTGKALDVYSRMSETAAVDYKELKELSPVEEIRPDRERVSSTCRNRVVPQPFRQQVMNVAHRSILGGHLGVKKTTDKITSNFYRPGIHSDITRFCQSCDICQRTVAKGNVSKVPIEKVPLIDTPFKRVAVDLVGPKYPPSESGHRYILTLVDHATRYPDAVPLKSITTESVAESLVDMYSRLGVPEEVLSDMGASLCRSAWLRCQDS